MDRGQAHVVTPVPFLILSLILEKCRISPSLPPLLHLSLEADLSKLQHTGDNSSNIWKKLIQIIYLFLVFFVLFLFLCPTGLDSGPAVVRVS